MYLSFFSLFFLKSESSKTLEQSRYTNTDCQHKKQRYHQLCSCLFTKFLCHIFRSSKASCASLCNRFVSPWFLFLNSDLKAFRTFGKPDSRTSFQMPRSIHIPFFHSSVHSLYISSLHTLFFLQDSVSLCHILLQFGSSSSHCHSCPYIQTEFIDQLRIIKLHLSNFFLSLFFLLLFLCCKLEYNHHSTK